MQDKYRPQEIESKHYQRWEQANWFKPADDGDAYCIMIPPPNVTGTLHMGHAFQDTIMDALTRFQRMQGKSALWQVGMDHAGIATQMVVERQLNAKGQTRHDLGREAFVSKVWDWKEESGGTIAKQLRRMGASVDWQNDRFTMDESLSAAVRKVFVDLYREDLIYRGKRLVNWDPVLHTALSDLEVLSEEEQGHLWHFQYPLADGSATMTVATTRPETMLGDTAVAVHPEDPRFASLVGKAIRLPLTDRLIPIIADDYVDPEFGSGCVKITPAHDFNDYEMGQRHDLPIINIFDDNAALNDNVPTDYRGLDRLDARKKIVEAIDALGLLEKIEPHKLMVPRGDRSQAVVEPYLTDQWYVRIQPLADPAIEAVKSGQIKLVPENWSKTYFEWMNNIQDWCISRQLWWGHRIPAWYDQNGKPYVGHDIDDVKAHYQLSDDVELVQDEDVLDTWFSSALWPFSTLDWPTDSERLKRYYPTSVLVTGFDIIFFWVARMIMMGLKFTGEVPFREVYIHGLIRDPDGQKMSKSKGNVLDPLDLIDGIELDALIEKRTTGLMQPHLAPKIEKSTRSQFPDGIPEFGCDALRFTFASLATTGRDIRFDLGRIEGYRNFCNKIWNAARYVGMATENYTKGDIELGVSERWIRSRFQERTNAIHQHFERYRLDLVAQEMYEFTWHEFCDWYLELSKTTLHDDSASDERKRGTQWVLLDTLERLMRLIHPLMPFISEEIWLTLATRLERAEPSVMLANYPEVSTQALDPDAEADVEWITRFVLGIRQIRGEMDISPGKPVPVLLANVDEPTRERVEQNRLLLSRAARLESIDYIAEEQAPTAAAALVGQLKILVPVAGLIDIDAEISRLTRQREKTASDLAKANAKLANARFVDNAPPEIVSQEKERQQRDQQTLTELDSQIRKLQQASDDG